MKFDFQSLYAGYSNVQLLRMLNDRDKYQTEAIAAAEAELATRTILDEDITASQDTMPATIDAAKAPATPIKSEEFSIFDEEEDREIQNLKSLQSKRWIIVGGISLHTLYVLYYYFMWLGMLSTLLAYNMTVQLFQTFINTAMHACTITGILLFIRLRKWGWYLLFVKTVMSILGIAITIITLSIADSYYRIQSLLMLIGMGAICFLLSTKAMSKSFGINRKQMLQTAAIAICVEIFIYFSNYLFA